MCIRDSTHTVPSNPVTASVTVSGTATAGQSYSLTCTATKIVNGLINSPTAAWFTGGTEITSGGGIEATLSSGGLVSTLTFNPLKTSHTTSDTQTYSCQASVSSPALTHPRTTSVVQVVSMNSKYTETPG